MPRPRRSAILVALLCGALLPRSLGAQGGARVQVQGIVDGEGWSTDTNSNFLTRNAGKAGVLGRVQMWGAVEAGRGFVFYAQGEAEQGDASGEQQVELDQFGLRYTASPSFVVDVGRFPHLIGTFAARRFSSRNPLVGAPDAYPVQYPHGVQFSGATRFLDYRVGVVDLPAVHEGYTPEPDRAWRPAIGGGITPYVGLRLGGSFTWGPYLNDELTSAQLAQRSWQNYAERIAAADLAFSFGYVELNAEAARSSYDVPNRAEPIAGWAYYVEGRYTLTPRLYVATRFERNDYPFVMAFPTFWVARKTDFHNEEYGVGFRLTARTLLKTSYRGDRWHVDAGNQAFVRPGGRAFAVQLSQTYDVMEWIERVRAR